MKRTLVVAVAAALAGPALAADVTVGLITKTESNPFFVKMKEGASAEAKKQGAKLLTGAGAKDGDNEGQVTALENMINAGAKGILITPSDTKAIVPSIERARKQGVLVIALDTATEPQTAVDALFATNNFNAGLLIGEWAKAAFDHSPMRSPALKLFVANSASTALSGSVAVSSAITSTPCCRAFLIAGTMAFVSLGVMRTPFAPALIMFSSAVTWPSLSPSLAPAPVRSFAPAFCASEAAPSFILTKNGFVSVFVMRPTTTGPAAETWLATRTTSAANGAASFWIM